MAVRNVSRGFHLSFVHLLCRLPYSSRVPCDDYNSSEAASDSEASSNGSESSDGSGSSEDSDDDGSTRARSPRDISSSEESPRSRKGGGDDSDDGGDDSDDNDDRTPRAAKGKTGGSSKQTTSKDKTDERSAPSPIQAGSAALGSSTPAANATDKLEFQLEAATLDVASNPSGDATLGDMFSVAGNAARPAAPAPDNAGKLGLEPGETLQQAVPAAAAGNTSSMQLGSIPLAGIGEGKGPSGSTGNASVNPGNAAGAALAVPSFMLNETGSMLATFDDMALSFLDAGNASGTRNTGFLSNETNIASRLSAAAEQPDQHVSESSLPDLILPAVGTPSSPWPPSSQASPPPESPEAKPELVPQQNETLPLFMLPGQDGQLAAFASSSDHGVGGPKEQDGDAGALPVWQLVAMGCAALGVMALLALGAYGYVWRSHRNVQHDNTAAAEPNVGEEVNGESDNVPVSSAAGCGAGPELSADNSTRTGVVDEAQGASCPVDGTGGTEGSTLTGDDSLATAASLEDVDMTFLRRTGSTSLRGDLMHIYSTQTQE
mmetsp:Transcript_37542/g.96019  ORF Transcript_37542/g.96019 Transcript_37542/m.96019 type:complete len:547 (-) Transcript_37542:921-2561(-)